MSLATKYSARAEADTDGGPASGSTFCLRSFGGKKDQRIDSPQVFEASFRTASSRGPRLSMVFEQCAAN